MRKITGNGSIRSCGIYKPLIHRIRCEPSYTQKPIEPVVRQRVTAQTFVGPLKLLFQKHILLNLVFGGVVYAVWGMVTSSTTGLFKTSFNLNELRLGLVFVPNGTPHQFKRLEAKINTSLCSITNSLQAWAPYWDQQLSGT